MKRLLPACAFVLVLSACGTVQRAAPHVTSATQPHTKAAARQEARRLLAHYVPPSGAVELARVPAGRRWLTRDLEWGVYGKLVDVHRYWRVPQSVDAIERAHEDQSLPGWGGGGTSSTAGPGNRLLNTESGYFRLGFGGRSIGRVLRVAAVKARGGSILRVDAVVVWHLSAKEREEIPAGVREIDIHGPHAGDQVTDRSQVRTIVRWFNRLEIAQSFGTPLGCPFQIQAAYTFAFRGSHGALLAKVAMPQFSGICSEGSYILRGRQVNSLIGGDIDYRVQELIGANWFGPPDTQELAGRREGKAAHEAAVLLHNFRPPPDATRSRAPKGYGGVLRSIPTPFGEFVRHTRFWRVDAKPAAVVAFLHAHDVPSGFEIHCGSNPHFGSTQCELETRPAGSRHLAYSVQRTASGTSILRVDAQVVWVYPRSPKESLGASRVREIDFSAPKVAKQITDPDEIARIVRWFNRVPIVPPGMGSGPGCVIRTEPVTLDFRGGGGKLLAHVSAAATEPQGGTSMCNPMRVTIAGTPQPSLISNDFFGRVQREIGVTVR